MKLAAAVLLLAFAFPPAATSAGIDDDVRILVRLREPAVVHGLDTGLPEVDAIAREHGVLAVRPAFRMNFARNAALKRRYGFDRTLLLAFPGRVDSGPLIARLGEAHGVVFAEEDVVGRAAQVPPNDTHYPDQWDRENTGQLGTPDADVDAEGGWALATGSPSVVIAVLDSGIDSAHPEFAGRIVAGFDFVNNDSDPEDDESHGTYVAGIALANANNAFQVAGIDWAAALMPVKVLDDAGFGTTTDLVDGITWATDNGADVINMSLINYPCSGSLANALQYALDGGAIPVASAGNDGIGDADVSGPGCIAQSISVGATTADDHRASFSATGSELDITAPGQGVRTVRYRIYTDGFSNFSGTSAAAPIVSGIAGLMRALRPAITPGEVRDLLEQTAEDRVGPPAEDMPGRDDFFGWGRVNMKDALAGVFPEPLRLGSAQPARLGVFRAATFSVVYSSASSTPPDFVQVVVDGPEPGTYAMAPAASGHPSLIDGSLQNGELYVADVVLSSTGTYAFHFEAETGGVPARYPAAGSIAGPTVDLVLAEDVATSETSVDSVIFDLDYTATHTLDSSSELVDEVVTGGSPSNRYSTLDHRYSFDVTGGDSVTFLVNANIIPFWALENDAYDVSYSTDGGTVWTPMLTVSEQNPGTAYKTFAMPPGTSGQVLVRFEDTDSTPGNDGTDRLAINHMLFRSEHAPTPGEAADLLVTAHDAMTGRLTLSWTPACGAADHNIVFGPLQDVSTYGYTGQECGVGAAGSYDQLTPGPGSWFLLVAGTDGGTKEGSYGTDAAGVTRPEQTDDPSCAFTRDLQFACD